MKTITLYKDNIMDNTKDNKILYIGNKKGNVKGNVKDNI